MFLNSFYTEYNALTHPVQLITFFLLIKLSCLYFRPNSVIIWLTKVSCHQHNYKNNKLKVFNIAWGMKYKMLNILKKYIKCIKLLRNIQYTVTCFSCTDQYKTSRSCTWWEWDFAKWIFNTKPEKQISMPIKNTLWQPNSLK